VMIAVLDGPPTAGYLSSWRRQHVPGVPKRWKVYVPAAETGRQ